MSTNIWTFRNEPKSIDEMVLSTDIKTKLKKALVELPNLMLIGPPGVGKGTFVNILFNTVNPDRIKINCSDETSIDNVRTKIKGFATTMGSTPIKVVFCNENDHLSFQAQAMLRDLMEQVQEMTRFIFACNYEHKVIPELKSRCQVIHLNSPPASDIFKHCLKVLENEKVKIKDKKSIVELIKEQYPDIRGIINTLQMNTVNGEIKSIKSFNANDVYESILNSIKEKNPNKIREILRSNMVDYPSLFNYLYENVSQFNDIGNAVILIGEHLYRDGFISIKEINFLSFVMKMIKDKVI